MRFLFLEPFYGGSHRDFADGLVRHSRHRIDLMTLPARFWKWRVRSAAPSFWRRLVERAGPAPPLAGYDGLIVSDMMSLSDFKAMAGPACPPILLYFHENQLTYPLSPGERRDYQYAFTDLTSALVADRILFNSRTHRESFFAHQERFLALMPDERPRWAVDLVRAKAGACYPGCWFGGEDPVPVTVERPPLVIWNHRWEFDKAPEVFVEALGRVANRGIAFRLALLGERCGEIPACFREAMARFGDRLETADYLADRNAYHAMLARGAVVVSTAIQENFGISLVEATRMGCLPLAPNRLSYPEILPPECHSLCLYDTVEDLVEKLSGALTAPDLHAETRQRLSLIMGRHAWSRVAPVYDGILADMVH